MEISTLEIEICNFIKENLVAKNVEVVPASELAGIGLDSFSLIEIVLFLERKFEIELPDEVLTPENIKTVSTISACALQHAEN